MIDSVPYLSYFLKDYFVFLTESNQLENNRQIQRSHLRLFLDCLNFLDSTSYHSWTFLYYLSISERDHFYTSTNSNEGRRVYPKTDSHAVWLAKLFLPDIAQNVTLEDLICIWRLTGSTLFLEWFMHVTGSASLFVCANAGWSRMWWLFPNYWYTRPDLVKAKLKLFLQMGADPHYEVLDFLGRKVTPTALMLHDPVALESWYQILQELDFNIEDFVERELETEPLKHSGWTTKTLSNLFVSSRRYKLVRPRVFKTCSSCGCHAVNIDESWFEYQEAIKNEQSIDPLRYFGKSPDDDHEISTDYAILNNCEKSGDNNNSNEFVASEYDCQQMDDFIKSSENWFRRVCASCKERFNQRPFENSDVLENEDAESLTSHMPGSFES